MTPAPPRLYLVRHALAASPGLMAGRADLPLLPEGERQAAHLRDELSGVTFTAAWSSPLLRARQTATIILSGNENNVQEAVLLNDLIEISLGAWDGRHKRELRREYPELWAARGKDILNIPPPGGESLIVLANRIRPVFAALCHEASDHQNSLLVAHQAVNRVIIADCIGLPISRILEIDQSPAAFSVLEVGKSGAAMLSRTPLRNRLSVFTTH